MIQILIDTCVWLDLAKSAKGERVLDTLEEFFNRTETSLIIPDIIIHEFEKNKQRVINDASRSLKSHFQIVREAVINFGNESERNLIISNLENLNHKIQSLGEAAVGSIDRIEKLFSKGKILKSSNKIKLRATERAINKKAPFHLAKNSIGDAIILESYIEQVTKARQTEIQFYFVTHNTRDFSLKSGNKKYPHEDLTNVFDLENSNYFINLSEALVHINSNVLEDIEVEFNWTMEPRNLSEIMEAEKDLEQKIWYKRHMEREHRINIGKLEIIDNSNYFIGDITKTINKRIWEGALESAKFVEQKFGKEDLELDDFEWGKVYGKLSALRWVIGDDWETYYI